MRFSRFFRFGSSKPGAARKPAHAAEDLDAFLSESGTHVPAKETARRSRNPLRLVALLAALAILEAVPAGLWVYQTLAVSEARAADTTPPPSYAPPIALGSPCEPPPLERAPSSPPVAAQGTARSAATATAGATAPAPAPGSVGGLVSVTAPVPMRIYARGRMVGTTEAETVMLPVGSHDLEFVSDEAGYKARRSVTVQAGRTATIRLDAPSGVVHVNASPWAEVWVGTQRLGETPIGNLQVPIGLREFVFRHPEFGERRKTAMVTLKEPVRVSIDMRAK